MMLLSKAILLYSPLDCCASKSAPKGCPRRTINRNACSFCAESTGSCSIGDSGTDQSSSTERELRVR
ncbi:hypothetical protein P692DRAFT_20104195 [Suillus brevipes Sb2]|nr:hypothetical protein P692DRAFT_20104195 [Suillus brevipes Sb2]